MTRETSFRRFEEALMNAMASMPAGYVGAGDDREKFVSPVEEVVMKLRDAIKDEMGIKR